MLARRACFAAVWVLLCSIICLASPCGGAKPAPPPAPVRAVAVAAPSHKSSGREEVLSKPQAVSAQSIGVRLSTTHIHFNTVPLCIAGAQNVLLTLVGDGSRQTSLTVRDLATTHPDFYAGLPEDRPLNMTRADSLEINVVVLPSRLGQLSGELHIKTTAGIVSVRLSAAAVENRYRVRPILAHAVALGAKLDVRVPLFNPSSEPLAITEVFTTGDFISFHVLQSNPDGVQLCSSTTGGDTECTDGHEPPETWTQLPLAVFKSQKWLLPGRQTAHILRVLARKDSLGTFTGFVHIHTNSDNLIIPVQLTVVRDGVVYSPAEIVCPSFPSHTASFVSAWNTEFPGLNSDPSLVSRARQSHNLLLLSQAQEFREQSCFAVLNRIGRLVQANLVDGLSKSLLDFFKVQSSHTVLVSNSLQQGCSGLSAADLVAPSGHLDSFAHEVDEQYKTHVFLLNAGEETLEVNDAQEQLSDESLFTVDHSPHVLPGSSYPQAVSTAFVTVSCRPPAQAAAATRQTSQILRSSLHITFNHTNPLHSLLTVPAKAVKVPGALLFNQANTQITTRLGPSGHRTENTHFEQLKRLSSSLSLLQTQRDLHSWATEDRLGHIRRLLLQDRTQGINQQQVTPQHTRIKASMRIVNAAVANYCAQSRILPTLTTVIHQLADPCLLSRARFMPTDETNGMGHDIHIFNGFTESLDIFKVLSTDPRVLVSVEASRPVPQHSFAAPVAVRHTAYFLRDGHNRSLSDMQHYLRCLPQLIKGHHCSDMKAEIVKCDHSQRGKAVCVTKALLLQHTIALMALILKEAGSLFGEMPCSALACNTGAVTLSAVESAQIHPSAQQSVMDVLDIQWGVDFRLIINGSTSTSSVRGWDGGPELIVPAFSSLFEECRLSPTTNFNYACAVLKEAHTRINPASKYVLGLVDLQHISLLLAKAELLDGLGKFAQELVWPMPKWLLAHQHQEGLTSELIALSLGVQALEDWPLHGDVSADLQARLLVQTNVSTFQIPVHFLDGPFFVSKSKMRKTPHGTNVDFLLRAHSSQETRPVGWSTDPVLLCSIGFWQQRVCSGKAAQVKCSSSFAVTSLAHTCHADASSRGKNVQALSAVSFSEQLQHVGSIAPMVYDVAALKGTGNHSKITGPVLLAPGALVQLEMTLFPAALLRWGLDGDSLLGPSMKQLRAGNQADLTIHDAIRLETDTGVSVLDAKLSVEPFHVLASIVSSDGIVSMSVLVGQPTHNTVTAHIPSTSWSNIEVSVHWQVIAANQSQLFRQHTWKTDDAAGASITAAIQQGIVRERCTLHMLLAWTSIANWLPAAASATEQLSLQIAQGRAESFALSLELSLEHSPICANQSEISGSFVLACVFAGLVFFRTGLGQVFGFVVQLVTAPASGTRGSIAHDEASDNLNVETTGFLSNATSQVEVESPGAARLADSRASEMPFRPSRCHASPGENSATSSTQTSIMATNSASIVPIGSDVKEVVLSSNVATALQALNPALSTEAIIKQLVEHVHSSPLAKDTSGTKGWTVPGLGSVSSQVDVDARDCAPCTEAPLELDAFIAPPLPASPFGGRSEAPSVHSEQSSAELFSDQAIGQLLGSREDGVAPPPFASALEVTLVTKEPPPGLEESHTATCIDLQPTPSASCDITQGLQLPSALPTSAALGLGPLHLQAGISGQQEVPRIQFGNGFANEFGSLWGSPSEAGMGLGGGAAGGYSLAALSGGLPVDEQVASRKQKLP